MTRGLRNLLLMTVGLMAVSAAVIACSSEEVSRPTAPQQPAPAAPAEAPQMGTVAKAAEPEEPAAPEPAAPAVPGTSPGEAQMEARAQSALATKRVVPEDPMGPQYGGTYVSSASIEPRSWEPYDSGQFWHSHHYEELGVGDWTVDRNVFDHTGFYVPAELRKGLVAESWEAPDDDTLVFKIRQGINFHDKFPFNGREFTADDVAYTWHRMAGLGSGFTEPSPSMRATWAPLKSVEAQDRYTVVFKYEPTISMLPALLTEGIGDSLYGRDGVDEFGDLKVPENNIGTGPFMVEEAIEGESITWLKNPNYWGHSQTDPENQLPYVDVFRQLVIKEFATQKAAFRTAQIDEIGGFTDRPTVTPREAETILDGCPDCGFHVRLPEGWSIGMNMDNPDKPWMDIDVRRALQMAIPLDEIANVYYRGFSDPTPYPGFGSLVQGFYTPFEDQPADVRAGFDYDPDAAKELLAAAGYPNGFDVNLWVSSSQDPDLAQLVKGYLSEVGVNMEIEEQEMGVMWGRMMAKELDDWVWDWACSQGDPMVRASTYY
jgi:peptide/nickel transport system substrate-binding protein